MAHTVSLADNVIRLRPITVADAAAHLVGEDDELVRWYTGGPSTLDTVASYLERCETQGQTDAAVKTFAIDDVTTTALTGTIDIQIDQPFLSAGQANLAYGVYPAWRGRGVASRAVALACKYLTDNQVADHAVIRVHPDNHASAAVALRCGYRFSHQAVDEHGPLDWYTKAVSDQTADPVPGLL
ncbi:GNAT family N-acetyltransferase [Nocardia amamiensis]|uniref:GNAT family N-acetyltransferase n=1 Tax=Nocardia amamiensis TaxID=404578 RepID=A0ABS0CRZ2_9NOCA|nr:GNAT family N-acetyltransferase [Nocardia amamiensis]MBF6299066.1 GNAT family N-acetyltransferase [Nocardia amamiensis]